jgi:hypothetical protein
MLLSSLFLVAVGCSAGADRRTLIEQRHGPSLPVRGALCVRLRPGSGSGVYPPSRRGVRRAPHNASPTRPGARDGPRPSAPSGTSARPASRTRRPLPVAHASSGRTARRRTRRVPVSAGRPSTLHAVRRGVPTRVPLPPVRRRASAGRRTSNSPPRTGHVGIRREVLGAGSRCMCGSGLVHRAPADSPHAILGRSSVYPHSRSTLKGSWRCPQGRKSPRSPPWRAAQWEPRRRDPAPWSHAPATATALACGYGGARLSRGSTLQVPRASPAHPVDPPGLTGVGA